MKRIKAACITQTVCFSNHDGDTSEYAKKMICQEYEKYKVQLDRCRTDFADIQNKKDCGGNRQWQNHYLRNWAANTKGKGII